MTQNDQTAPELTGEERLKRKTRRMWIIIGFLFVAGFILGLGVSRAEDAMGFEFGGPWPREIALGALAIFLLSIGIGSPLMHREMDDYTKDIHRKSATFAASVVMVGYPVWFLLWKASLVVEPIHWVIFIAAYAGLYAALIYYRYR